MSRFVAIFHGLLLASALALSVGPSRAADQVVAKVNGETVMLSEVEAALSQSPPPLTPPTTAQRRRIRYDALTVIVDDRLIRQFLKEHGPAVDSAEVEKQYAALVEAQRKEGRGIGEYLKSLNRTEAQVRENFKLMLQLAKFIDSQITDEKLKPYFEANKDFFEKTTVRTSHIVIRTPPGTTIDEKDKAKKKLQSLRTELLAGKIAFADAAKEHSQCPSAPKGGDIGFVFRKFQVDEPYARTAFALKVGELSDLVESDFGYHLIHCTDRKPGKAVSFETAKTDVRECYETELRQLLIVRLREKAKIEITLP